jgi:hypothetical protein
MTPSEFIRALHALDERLKTVRTVALSLILFAGLALAATFGVRMVPSGFAKTCAAFAAIGGLGAVVVGRFLSWRRTEIYDDILLAGFRHVAGPEVGRRAAELVALPRRRQLADTLDRFVELASSGHPSSVPLHRAALREMGPQVREIADHLRCPESRIQPATMVLVRRLVTDGAESPLFTPVGEPRDLEKALARIEREIRADHGEDGLRLAA